MSTVSVAALPQGAMLGPEGGTWPQALGSAGRHSLLGADLAPGSNPPPPTTCAC